MPEWRPLNEIMNGEEACKNFNMLPWALDEKHANDPKISGPAAGVVLTLNYQHWISLSATDAEQAGHALLKLAAVCKRIETGDLSPSCLSGEEGQKIMSALFGKGAS